MENTKHTPGPWQFQPVRGCKDIGPKVGELRKKIDAVAVTVGMANDIEDKANARLIAAAPDMLAALRSIIPSFEARLTAKPKDVEAWDLLSAAKAAIDKAEGR